MSDPQQKIRKLVISKDNQIKSLKKALKEVTLQKDIAERYNDRGCHLVIAINQIDRLEKKLKLTEKILDLQGKDDEASKKLIQKLRERIYIVNGSIASHRDWVQEAREYSDEWLKHTNEGR